jgi:tetratricopeptide (TPR) repeat protein
MKTVSNLSADKKNFAENNNLDQVKQKENKQQIEPIPEVVNLNEKEKNDVAKNMREATRYLLDKRFKEAISIYDEVLRIDITNWECWYNKGMSYLSLGRNTEAVKCFDKSIEYNFPEGQVAVYKGGEVWFFRGMGLRRSGALEDSLESYERALKLDFRQGDNMVVECLREISYTYMALKEYDIAISILDGALKIDSKSSALWQTKGTCLFMLSRHDEAIECYDKAIELMPDDIFTWNQKGAVLLTVQRYNDALECFDQTLDIDSKYAEGWHNKGVALFNVGRREEGIECIKKAAQLGFKMSIDFLKQNQ